MMGFMARLAAQKARERDDVADAYERFRQSQQERKPMKITIDEAVTAIRKLEVACDQLEQEVKDLRSESFRRGEIIDGLHGSDVHYPYAKDETRRYTRHDLEMRFEKQSATIVRLQAEFEGMKEFRSEALTQRDQARDVARRAEEIRDEWRAIAKKGLNYMPRIGWSEETLDEARQKGLDEAHQTIVSAHQSTSYWKNRAKAAEALKNVD